MPKNSRKNRGRPSLNSIPDLVKHARQLAPASFYADSMNYTVHQVHFPAFVNICPQHLECFICLGVLNSPLKLLCGLFICSTCFIKSIETMESVHCPMCVNHHSLTKDDIIPLTRFTFVCWKVSA